MGWSDYQRWIDRGRPFRLMTPAQDLKTKLRAHGYTVYDIGNESHLTHEPPEDHTPYSETSYPGSSVYGVGYAEDIMPPAPGQRSKVDGLPLPSLAQLGAQLVADRKAGVPGIKWLKYINWEPSGPGGPCYQDSWKPNYARRSSTDRGHIHASGLTGFESSSIGAGYDPVARIRGGDDEMSEAEIIAAVRKAITSDPATREALRQAPWEFLPADHGGKTTAHAIVLNGLPVLGAQLAALAGRDFTDEPAIVAGVLAGLPAETIAAAIPPTMAKQVADQLAARLAS